MSDKKDSTKKENIPEHYNDKEAAYNRYVDAPYNDYNDDQRYDFQNYGYDYPRQYDDESSEDKKKKTGRKKISMEYIEGKNKRSVTFSKRKKGIMKKAYMN